MKKMIPLLGATVLAFSLVSCSDGETNETSNESEQSDSTANHAAEQQVYTLSDTVTVGNGVTISDLEFSTAGCEFVYPPPQDAVKFELIAKLENDTEEELSEGLLASDFSFTNSDGSTVDSTEISLGEPPCEDSDAAEFLDIAPGETRRGAVTLEAPADAQEMTFHTSLIEGAAPVTWDVADNIDQMEVTEAAADNAAG